MRGPPSSASRAASCLGETFQHHLYQTTAGVVQLYLRDPSGNIVECDYARVGDLDPAIAALVKRWSDDDAPTRAGPQRIIPDSRAGTTAACLR